MTEVCKPTPAAPVGPLQKRSEYPHRISDPSQATPNITIYASSPPSTDSATLDSEESSPLIIIEHIENPVHSKSDDSSVYSKSDTVASKAAGLKQFYQCESCDYYSHNKHYLKQHMDLVHNSDRPYKCPFCDYAGKRSHSLREHLVVHTNERPYECDYCNATFRKKGHLTNHIKLHTSQKSITCKLCNQTLPDVATFVAHLKTDHNTDKIYACERCGFVASDKIGIMKHVAIHTNDQFYRCSKCSFVTSDVSSLSSHADSHLPKQSNVPIELPANKEMIIKCTECGFSDSDTNKMKTHLLKHLTASKKSVLPIKPSALPQSHVLSYSIDQPLPKNTSYKCTECSFTDKDATVFIKHLLTHKVKQQSAEKALQVKETQQQTQMQKHFVVTPIAKKNTCQNSTPPFIFDPSTGRFRCIICGYTCEFQRTIKAHIWKHTGHKNINYPMFQNGPLSIYDDQTPIRLDKGPSQIAHGTILSIKQEVVQKNVSGSTEDTESHLNDLVTASIGQKVHGESSVSGTIFVKSSVLFNSSNRSEGDIGGKAVVVKESPSELKQDDSSGNPATVESLQPTKETTILQSIINDETTDTVKAKIESIRVTLAKSVVVSPSTDVVSHSDASHLNETNESQFANSSSPKVTPKSSPTEIAVVSEADISKQAPVLTDVNKQWDDVNKQWDEPMKQEASVVVESVDTVPPSSVFTSMKIQQNSPRICNQQKLDSEPVEINVQLPLSSECSDEISNPPKEIEWQNQNVSGKGSVLKQTLLAADVSKDNESAITLLSLLKKGPNKNPACNMSPVTMSDKALENVSCSDKESRSDSETDPASEGGDDSTSSRPKAGICSSLLAVIEQLRERANSESDTTNPLNGRVNIQAIKKECLMEVELPAENMQNIEQLEEEGEIKFRCKFCHYSNPRALLIKLHMRLHKSKQPFECSLCSFIAKSSENLQDHMIKHCKVRTYQCKLCPSAFNYKSQLRAHMRAHSDKDPFCCESCDFETMDATTYRTHVRYHIDKSCFRCDSCKEIFPTLSDLNQHILELSCKNMLNCEECPFVATDNAGLICHIRETHRDFHCLECNFTCSTRLALTHHATSHRHSVASDDSGLLKCELCDFTAVSSRSLKSHMKRHINDQRYVQQPLEQYKCNLCGYVCHHLPSLKSHMWRHASDRNYSYEFTNDVINAAIDYDCRIDSTKIDDPDVMEKILNSERQILEGRLNRSVCPGGAAAICWVTFRCCQCGFETINKADLNVHMKSHSDIIQRTLEVIRGNPKTCKRPGEDNIQTANDQAKSLKIEDNG